MTRIFVNQKARLSYGVELTWGSRHKLIRHEIKIAHV
jgi:hypothetical protein